MTTFVGHIKNGFLDRMAKFTLPARAVWLALANGADRDGECFPSISAIQKAAGLARSTVYKAIDELVVGGEIEVTPGGGKGNPSNHYRFLGGPQNELVQSANQFKPRTKVVRTTDKGGPPNRLKPDTRTRHKNQSARKRFFPPSVAEVEAYGRERGNHVDAERFVDYYTSKGWMVGKNQMKDWKAAVRTWEGNGFSNGDSVAAKNCDFSFDPGDKM